MPGSGSPETDSRLLFEGSMVHQDDPCHHLDEKEIVSQQTLKSRGKKALRRCVIFIVRDPYLDIRNGYMEVP